MGGRCTTGRAAGGGCCGCGVGTCGSRIASQVTPARSRLQAARARTPHKYKYLCGASTNMVGRWGGGTGVGGEAGRGGGRTAATQAAGGCKSCGGCTFISWGGGGEEDGGDPGTNIYLALAPRFPCPPPCWRRRRQSGAAPHTIYSALRTICEPAAQSLWRGGNSKFRTIHAQGPCSSLYVEDVEDFSISAKRFDNSRRACQRRRWLVGHPCRRALCLPPRSRQRATRASPNNRLNVQKTIFFCVWICRNILKICGAPSGMSASSLLWFARFIFVLQSRINLPS